MRADDYQVGGDHYTKMDIQPWRIMAALMTKEELIGYFKGSCIKYGYRSGHKEGTDDVSKYAHHEKKLMELKDEK